MVKPREKEVNKALMTSSLRLAQAALSCLVACHLCGHAHAVRPASFLRNSRGHSLRCPEHSDPDAPRRILYNINHVKLVSNEVPLLLSFGYEVYIPKHLPSSINEATSAGVIHEYDKSLTISKVDLALLDSHNFYEEKSWGSDVAKVIDANFCMVITAAYSTPIDAFLSHLSVPIGIRVFGRAAPDTYSSAFPENVKTTILDHKSRCFFLSAYPHLAEVEEELKDMFRFAPVTLNHDKTYFQREVTKKSVLYQCGRINVSSYYTKKVNKFISDFSGSGIDYAIYGTARSQFEHLHNLGRPSSEEINRLFASYSAMYYDSVEPRHLHYHPLEAMNAKMPVVFLQDGMLARFMPYSPAKSVDVDDAKRKLQRLIQGDSDFEKEIVWHQDVLLQSMKNSNNLDKWRAVLGEVGCGTREREV